MKSTLLLIFLLHAITSWSQSSKPNKQELLKVLNLTMNQKPGSNNNYSCQNGLCGEWLSVNKNGQFYKSDTVKLYNSCNFYSIDSAYCTFKIWEFGKNKKFSQCDEETCHEPPLRTFEINLRFDNKKQKKIRPNSYHILQSGSSVFIETLIDLSPFEKYQVLSITENKSMGEHAYMLTLVRQKRK